MKKNIYFLFAIFIANIFSAQTELVRWNQANFSPTVNSGNITAASTASGLGVSSLSWDVSFFQLSNVPISSTIDTSKYIQYSIAPNSNYKIALSSFNLTYRSWDATGQKLEIRYSVNSDFSNPQTLTNITTTDKNWHTISLSSFANSVVSSGKTMYIRLYVYNGQYQTFHISNGNGGVAPNAVGTVSVNTPLAAQANNDSYNVYANTGTVLNILANDISDSNISGITITQQPAHGTLVVNGTSNVTYNPAAGYSGSDSFKYKISNDAPGMSNEATAAIDVVTAVPVAGNDTYSVYNNSNNNVLNILNNDTSTLMITGIVVTQQPAHGTLTVNGTTDVSYKPATGYVGADTFRYKISNITASSNEALVSINVAQDPNTAVPVANDDNYTGFKNTDSNFNILSNDTSILAINGITVTQQPAHGTLTVNGTTNVTYKPTTGYSGTDSFKYKANNATGASNEATVSVTVIEMPPSPLVRWNNGSVAPTTYNNSVTAGNIEYSNVNMGSATWSGPLYSFGGWPSQTTVNNSYYVQFSVSPKNGYKLNLSEFNFQCFMTGAGTMKIDYSLNSNFSNPINLVSGLTPSTSESSPTTVSLNNFNSPVATDGQVVYVRIYVYNTYQTLYIKYANGSNTVGPAFIGTVSSSSVAPVATNDTAITTIDNDIDISVLENDDYSNIVSSIALSQPSHGTATLNSDKTVNYLPAAGFIGSDSFTYNITNSYGTSNSATVSVNINPATTTSLIRWDSASAAYYPTSYQNFISAGQPITASGVSLSTSAESLPVYVIGNLTDSNINTSKYIQFKLNNTSTTKTIEPKNFSFSGRGYNAGKYEIRYSKSVDFSSYQTLKSGTFSNSYAMIDGDFDSVKVEAGETLYIRVYFYNSTSSYVIQYYTGSTGPAITGLFYNKVYSSTDTIWQNSSNPHWSNGTPTATKNAIIDTSYNTTSDGNFESNNLTINAGAKLTITTGSFVTVNGQITNNSDAASLIVENEGSLLQKSNAENIGSITVKKSALIPKMGYNYWSSPVVAQNLYQFSEGYNQASTTGTGTPWNRFYVYNESNDYFVTSITNEITLNSSSVFQKARGYAIRGKNSFPDKVTTASPASVFEFVGVPQNGDISYNLKYTNSVRGYNMVGNPYPSNLDFDVLFAANSTKIEGVAYCWTNNDDQIISQQSNGYTGNNYAIYNGTGGMSATYFGYNNKKPNGYISVGQGFIVKTKAAGKNQPLIFNNTMRTGDNANFYNKNADNKAQKDRFWLEFKSPTDVNNEILIGYLQDATDYYDRDFDTELLAVGNDSFWSVLDTKKLGIQAKRAPLYNEDILKLGIKAAVSGNYTISLTDKDGVFENTQVIYLNDKYLGKITNLSNEAYVFTTNPGQYEDRFEIIYKSIQTLGTDNSVKKGIQIYKDIQNFVIKSDEDLQDVSLYDSTGKLIFNTKNAKKEILIDKTNLAEGMYIIKANSRNTTMTKKVLK